MPRKKLDLPLSVDFLSILDESGEIDTDLEPDLDRKTLLAMHRTMLLARRFDERMLQLQREGRLGTFGPVKGQEAAQVGAASAIRSTDWSVPSYREIAAQLWRGLSMSGLLLYNAGYNEGGRIPDGQKDTPISIPVGSQMLHAVGLAYAARLRGEDEVTMTWFGDGATSEGDFHEAMNFGATWKLPVVFVCQNNRYAISVPLEKQTASTTLAQKALAYGMPGMQVDGNDVLGVHAAAREAVQRARNGDGPTMIECLTYRLGVHTTADDPSKYRSPEEEERWARRDPLPRFQQHLISKELLDEDRIAELDSEVQSEVEQAWNEARERMAELDDDPTQVFEHAYAELPPYVREQRDWLARERGKE